MAIAEKYLGARLAEFVSAFPTTTNSELMNEYGLRFSTLHRIARELGLRKTEEFMQAQFTANFRKASLINRADGYRIQREHLARLRANGKCNKGYPKGHNPKEGMTEEQWQERNRKITETNRKLREEEHRRVRWGLEQRTKFRITEPNRNRDCARYRLKNLYHYKVEHHSNLFVITPETVRNQPLEERYARKYKFRYEVQK